MAEYTYYAWAGTGICQESIRNKLDVYSRKNINEVERLACEKIGCQYAVGLSG